MVQNISWKETAYNIIVGSGIKVVQALFPEYFAKEPVRPTDRYIEYPFVLSNLPRTKMINPKSVLDVGCSGSIFPLLLKALNYDVTGIDIRPYPMNRFNFIKKDICEISEPKDYFDAITAISTIEHIGLKDRYGITKGTDKEALRNIHRLLKPEGILLMTVPFGKKYEVLKNHKIYAEYSLMYILDGFRYNYTTVPSPEAKYDIALIRATK